MKDKKLRIILNINLALILLMILMLFSFMEALNKGSDINPVTIVGTLITLACVFYSIVFFIWNLVLYVRVFLKKVIKKGYYRSSIIILVAAVIVPYALVGLFCLIGFISR